MTVQVAIPFSAGPASVQIYVQPPRVGLMDGVQKVHSQSSTYSSLTPGTAYRFAVRTEKEFFPDSPSVSINITAAPQTPQDVTLSQRVVTSVFVAWRPPPGLVEGYKVCYGMHIVKPTLWESIYVQIPSHEISHLIPGTEYGLSIQSVLGSDLSSAVHRLFSTRPAGVCGLRLDRINASSVTIIWDNASGNFDFYRVTVVNASVTSTFRIPKEERVAMVAGLMFSVCISDSGTSNCFLYLPWTNSSPCGEADSGLFSPVEASAYNCPPD
uniref:Fibronectin type-III domain-containing protein n=1 Tax=Knipowitschia caucasica TaxID=637954 RepID=A0AAV2KQG5_KNICA